MKVLITGGCGFVGSQIALFLKKQRPEWNVISLDNLKRRGSELNLSRLKKSNVSFIHGDIRKKEDIEQVGAVDLIIEAAAEPSVLAGLHGSPDYLIETNLNGTINCLNYAKTHKAKFIFLSTSRVYPIQQIEHIKFYESETRFEICKDQSLKGVSGIGISEDFSLLGSRSLYGTSKYASELFIEEYCQLLGLEALVNRCGVLAGPYQMGKVDQGVMVLWVARHFWKKDLSYFGYGGKGKQVRDVLHIDDLCDLLLIQIDEFAKFMGKTFNVGGGREVSTSLLELTSICQEVTGNSINISSVPETRVADIRIYLSDTSKIKTLSYWTPRRSIRDIVIDIHNWLIENESQLKYILN